ncbi:BON domain-containing protein [Paraburkholderia sp. CNPSo 3076]|uniref:BON domain-containing protein n=1 Tax=Paraburkholderia sp. CNPSo 3076 TaxID=2940936 RepID=UPI002253E34B|nr:BON domain-containing protein [Paraburkholderia sp. CNPSo 3076]MCX5543449.1 BON domain-containing protein [Paraburkholderia sp. CNPSo 3076]
MKAIQMFKLAAATALVAASFQVYAQDASAPAAAEAPTSGPTASAQHNVNQSKAALRQARAANRALGRKVRAALARDRNISVSNITVRAKDGAVILQGTVPEQAQIQRAGDVAKGVEGVTSVRNALTIRPVGT